MVADLSQTQTVVRLSSGEAEYAAAVRGVAEGVYLRSVMRFLGRDLHLELVTDSTASIGVMRRLGCGKRLKHVETEMFFLQQLVRGGVVTVTKEKGTNLPPDLCTKHMCWAKMQHLLSKLDVLVRGTPGTTASTTL